MKKGRWIFRNINLGLRTEVILNMSFLMLAAILLIGFTISNINERSIVQEKKRTGNRMVQDFQTIMDFILKDRTELSLSHPLVKREIQDFVRLYSRERGFNELLVVDHQFNIITSKKPGMIAGRSTDPFLEKAIRTGELSTEIEKSGSFFSSSYKKMKLSSPLWHQGKIVGGIQMEVPILDVMMNLLESKKIILITFIVEFCDMIQKGRITVTGFLWRVF